MIDNDKWLETDSSETLIYVHIIKFKCKADLIKLRQIKIFPCPERNEIRLALNSKIHYKKRKKWCDTCQEVSATEIYEGDLTCARAEFA